MKEREGYYSLYNDKYSHIRLEAMLDAQARGKTSVKDLDMAAALAMRILTDKKGKESEDKFKKMADSYNFIKTVRMASPIDDVFNGIDAWMTFSKKSRLPALPAQIKSSYTGVEEFKETKKFKNLNGMIFVLNCARHITNSQFREQFELEVARIRTILNKDS
jgi:hypothetical protein